jgi:hypothetical protein
LKYRMILVQFDTCSTIKETTTAELPDFKLLSKRN